LLKVQTLSMVNASLLLIIAQPRSGTNLFCQTMTQHPQVLMHAELFNSKKAMGARQFLERIPEVINQTRRENPVRFVREVLKHHTSNQTVVGFKLFRGQVASEADVATLIGMAAHIIIIKRRDTLAWYVSYRLAQMTGDWLAHPSKIPKVAPPVPVLSLDNMRENVASQNAWYNMTDRMLSQSGKPSSIVLRLEYEHDLQDLARLRTTLKRVEKFVNVTPYFRDRPPVVRLSRQAQFDPPRLSCSLPNCR